MTSVTWFNWRWLLLRLSKSQSPTTVLQLRLPSPGRPHYTYQRLSGCYDRTIYIFGANFENQLYKNKQNVSVIFTCPLVFMATAVRIKATVLNISIKDTGIATANVRAGRFSWHPSSFPEICLNTTISSPEEQHFDLRLKTQFVHYDLRRSILRYFVSISRESKLIGICKILLIINWSYFTSPILFMPNFRGGGGVLPYITYRI